MKFQHSLFVLLMCTLALVAACNTPTMTAPDPDPPGNGNGNGRTVNRPAVQSYSLQGSSIDPRESELAIRFDQEIRAGRGTIELRSEAATQNFVVTEGSQVSISADTLTLRGLNLALGTGYRIYIPAAAVRNASGDANAEVFTNPLNPATILFTTQSEITAPRITSTSTTLNSARTEISLTLSEAVTLQAEHGIRVTNSQMQTVAISTVRVDNDTELVVVLASALADESYTLNIPPNAFQDSATNGNVAATFSFLVDTIAPTVLSISLLTSSDIEIIFSENISPIAGSITVQRSSSTTISNPSYDINTPGIVTISGATLTFGQFFNSGDALTVIVPAGIFRDAAGNTNPAFSDQLIAE